MQPEISLPFFTKAGYLTLSYVIASRPPSSK